MYTITNFMQLQIFIYIFNTLTLYFLNWIIQFWIPQLNESLWVSFSGLWQLLVSNVLATWCGTRRVSTTKSSPVPSKHFASPQVCFLCFSTYPRHFSGKLGVLASADICQAEASLPMKTVLQRGQGQYLPTMTCVSICNSSMSWFRCFLFADVYTDGFYWAKTQLFKWYHHIIISCMLCDSQPLSWIVLTMGGNSVCGVGSGGHGGELLQEQTVIVECLDGLEEHRHHLCLKLKKTCLS